MIVTKRWGLILAALGAVATAQAAQANPVDGEAQAPQNVTVLDRENRPILYHIDKPASSAKMPILLVVDGSGCRGSLRKAFASLFKPGKEGFPDYAKVWVNKPGIDPESTDMRGCSEEFRERYSIDTAVTDHLRVLQHLRGTAKDWWDGRLMIWGWSDGGDIAARLVAYYPDVERAFLGAQGGGLTMATHMEDYWQCPADRVKPEQRESCLKQMREWFAEVRQKPLSSLGNGESNFLWRSRLFTDLGTLLAYDDTPIFIAHGALDRDNTPVQSARVLINRLNEAERANLTYCEIQVMKHGFDGNQREEKRAFDEASLAWLLGLPDAEARLDPFCDKDPPLAQIAPPEAPPAEGE
jgi:pimeloyl-ACP methyl ester carboxylesterase